MVKMVRDSAIAIGALAALLAVGVLAIRYYLYKPDVIVNDGSDKHIQAAKNADVGETKHSEGIKHEQKAEALQERIEAARKHVESLSIPVPKPYESGNDDVDAMDRLRIHNEFLLADNSRLNSLVVALKDENKLLYMQNDELKLSVASFKASSISYKSAYDLEVQARNLDRIAYEAKLSAQKAQTLRVGIITFGGGLLGGLAVRR